MTLFPPKMSSYESYFLRKRAKKCFYVKGYKHKQRYCVIPFIITRSHYGQQWGYFPHCWLHSLCFSRRLNWQASDYGPVGFTTRDLQFKYHPLPWTFYISSKHKLRKLYGRGYGLLDLKNPILSSLERVLLDNSTYSFSLYWFLRCSETCRGCRAKRCGWPCRSLPRVPPATGTAEWLQWSNIRAEARHKNNIFASSSTFVRLSRKLCSQKILHFYSIQKREKMFSLEFRPVRRLLNCQEYLIKTFLIRSLNPGNSEWAISIKNFDLNLTLFLEFWFYFPHIFLLVIQDIFGRLFRVTIELCLYRLTQNVAKVNMQETPNFNSQIYFFNFFIFFAPASHRHTFTTTFSTKLFDRTPVCRVVLCGAMRGKASCCYFQNTGEQNFEGVRTLKVCQSVSAAFEKGPSFVLSVPSFPPT